MFSPCQPYGSIQTPPLGSDPGPGSANHRRTSSPPGLVFGPKATPEDTNVVVVEGRGAFVHAPSLAAQEEYRAPDQGSSAPQYAAREVIVKEDGAADEAFVPQGKTVRVGGVDSLKATAPHDEEGTDHAASEGLTKTIRTFGLHPDNNGNINRTMFIEALLSRQILRRFNRTRLPPSWLRDFRESFPTHAAGLNTEITDVEFFYGRDGWPDEFFALSPRRIYQVSQYFDKIRYIGGFDVASIEAMLWPSQCAVWEKGLEVDSGGNDFPEEDEPWEGGVPKFGQIGVPEGEGKGVQVENRPEDESQEEEEEEDEEDGRSSWSIRVSSVLLLMPDPILIISLALCGGLKP